MNSFVFCRNCDSLIDKLCTQLRSRMREQENDRGIVVAICCVVTWLLFSLSLLTDEFVRLLFFVCLRCAPLVRLGTRLGCLPTYFTQFSYRVKVGKKLLWHVWRFYSSFSFKLSRKNFSHERSSEIMVLLIKHTADFWNLSLQLHKIFFLNKQSNVWRRYEGGLI